MGNLGTQTEPNGNLTPTAGDFVTSYGYDEIDTSGDPPDSEAHDFGYAYDPNGNLVSITDASSGRRVDS